MKIYPDAQVKTNAEAHAAKLTAQKLKINQANLEMADKLETSADAYLRLENAPLRGMGGELIPQASRGLCQATLPLKVPNKVTLDASLDRMELVENNGVLNMALDAAESIGVVSPIEQMLVHQMAAAHRTALDLMALAGNTKDPIEKCRLLNTAVRFMDTYQKAVLTINKIRTGGQQIVVVQHVQVTEGGQAVINGSVDTEGGNKG